jgi:hypothetical protein
MYCDIVKIEVTVSPCLVSELQFPAPSPIKWIQTWLSYPNSGPGVCCMDNDAMICPRESGETHVYGQQFRVAG